MVIVGRDTIVAGRLVAAITHPYHADTDPNNFVTKVFRLSPQDTKPGTVSELISLEQQDFTAERSRNPYRYDRFVRADNEAPFTGSESVYLDEDGVRALVA
jgi:hypothetical protein